MTSDRSRQLGLTLMEVLIAVLLLSLLSTSALLVFRVALNAMEKANRHFHEQRRLLATREILQQMIAGMMPVVAECVREADEPRIKMMFFQGEPQSMRFVTSYSLHGGIRGYPQIVELQVIPRNDGPGYRLIVNEHLYVGPASAGEFCLGPGLDPITGQRVPLFRPILVGPSSFVLMDQLASVRMLYLAQLNPQGPAVWLERWPYERWPRAIRFELTALEAAKAPYRLSSFTVPVPINQDPYFYYQDVWGK